MSDTRPPTPTPNPDRPTVSGLSPTPPVDGVEDGPEVKKRSVKPQRRAKSPRAAKKSMADLLVGTVLSERYKLVSKVGEGAMGWVFLAEHVEINKKFAVKVLRPSLCRLKEAVSRFKREARAATSIGSQHIVDITDFGTTETGAAFFVMEHLDGEDLAETLKREKSLAWDRVRAITTQLCEALQAAHDAGIYHRDVKPANFYRVTRGDNQDFIKVLDFGIARLANPTDSIVTQTGVVMGTPDFMAPEQALGRHVDHRADVYSLGATAYALLTGKPPFVGKSEYDVIYKQLNEAPRPPSELVENLPPWAEEVILKAMLKDPDERYQSMREFAEALEAEPADGTKPEAASKGTKGDSNANKWQQSSTPKAANATGISAVVWLVGFAMLAVIGGLAFAVFSK